MGKRASEKILSNCEKCGTPLIMLRDGSGTYFCPKCEDFIIPPSEK